MKPSKALRACGVHRGLWILLLGLACALQLYWEGKRLRIYLHQTIFIYYLNLTSNKLFETFCKKNIKVSNLTFDKIDNSGNLLTWKFKGRSSKYTSNSFASSAFWKGLDELENELDPKNIEKLIIFLEVIRTQEKFSKVRTNMKHGCWRNEENLMTHCRTFGCWQFTNWIIYLKHCNTFIRENKTAEVCRTRKTF